MNDAWTFSQWALKDFGLPIIWCVALRRPPDSGVDDVPGLWHGFEAANDDEF